MFFSSTKIFEIVLLSSNLNAEPHYIIAVTILRFEHKQHNHLAMWIVQAALSQHLGLL